jgi:hypothetical protein
MPCQAARRLALSCRSVTEPWKRKGIPQLTETARVKINLVKFPKFCREKSFQCSPRAGESGNVIETHEHTGDFKEWQLDQNVCDYRVSRLS